jgi:hypothetical protein
MFEGRGMMIHTHIDRNRAVPAWAAVGVPLIGIPLMVALLALAGPSDRERLGAQDAVLTTETVETQAIDQEIDAETTKVMHSLRSG